MRRRPGASFPGTMAGVTVALARLGLPEPEPTADDLRQAGTRHGGERLSFFRRRAAFRAFIGRTLVVPPGDVVLAYDGSGAPRLSAPLRWPFVSVAARGCWAVFALAAQPVGIDIEILDPLAEPAWAALTPAERDSVRAGSGPARAETFLRIWTAKEAYLKARGTGLMRDPATIEIGWETASGFSVRDGGAAAPGEGEWALAERSGHILVVSAWRDGA